MSQTDAASGDFTQIALSEKCIYFFTLLLLDLQLHGSRRIFFVTKHLCQAQSRFISTVFFFIWILYNAKSRASAVYKWSIITIYKEMEANSQWPLFDCYYICIFLIHGSGQKQPI